MALRKAVSKAYEQEALRVQLQNVPPLLCPALLQRDGRDPQPVYPHLVNQRNHDRRHVAILAVRLRRALVSGCVRAD